MKKTFSIECEMEERWIPYFMSMLKRMEMLGDVGASRYVGIYSDGDGDFRPKFKTDVSFEKQKPSKQEEGDFVYDAG